MVSTRSRTGAIKPKRYLHHHEEGEEHMMEQEEQQEELIVIYISPKNKSAASTPKKRGRPSGTKRPAKGRKSAAARHEGISESEYEEEPSTPRGATKQRGAGRGRSTGKKMKVGGRTRKPTTASSKKAKTESAAESPKAPHPSEEEQEQPPQEATTMQQQQPQDFQPAEALPMEEEEQNKGDIGDLVHQTDIMQYLNPEEPTAAENQQQMQQAEEEEAPYPPEPEFPPEAVEEFMFDEGQQEGELGGGEEMQEQEPQEEALQPAATQQKEEQAQAGEAPSAAQQQNPTAEPGIIESGRVFFFYRPRVGMEEAESLSDVQRFFMLLEPSNGPGNKTRLAIIGKKRLPDIEKKERFFGFIEAVGTSVEDLVGSKLGERTYETKTRGTRTVAAARAVGQGGYSIVEHKDKDHVHFVYKLEVPSEPGPVQEDFKIDSEGSFVFSVKNPKNEPQQGGAIGLEEKAEYTEEKKEEFGGYAWIPVRDPQLLDFEKCEFFLVGAACDLKEELGSVGAEAEKAEDDEAQRLCANADDECMLEQLKKDVNAEDVGIDVEPIATGEWK